MHSFFIFALFLWYFWYFYFSSSKSVALPKQSKTTKVNPIPRLYSTKDHFWFKEGNTVLWEGEIPPSYTFHRDKIVEQSICHSVADYDNILATGQVLYNYLKENPVLEELLNFQEDTSLVVQRGDVFYFTCYGGNIERLNVCPSGQIFSKGMCHAIEPCTGQRDGTRLPDKSNLHKYIVCNNETASTHQCPNHTFFLFSTCRPKDDIIHYCSFFQNSILLNPTTRIDCQGKFPVFTTCPPGFKFFDIKECEPTDCEGLPDGTKLSNPKVTNGLFRYSPGYYDCRNNRISSNIQCPRVWDHHLSKGDNLTHLPMVFDGQKCTVPEFCTNVSADDPETIVPLYNFKKFVGNWPESETYDSLAGYQCQGTKRTLVDLAVGERVSKRFKREDACDTADSLVPILRQPRRYYNCAQKSVEQCPDGMEFNGRKCKRSLEYPFRFEEMGLFQFDSLTFDNWIKPWGYSRDVSVEPCPKDAPNYLKLYNVCSHGDCEPYPFLSQLFSLAILLPEGGSKCSFEPFSRLLLKDSVDFPYSFWSQRRVEEHVPINLEPCKEGTRIQTGSFVWDSTIFMTCDMQQPFVFCPSSMTEGIVKVNHRFACKVPSESNSIFASTVPMAFEMNEIKSVKPANPFIEHIVKINDGPEQILPADGIEIEKETRFKLWVKQPVILEYRNRVTYPPDVGYHEGTYTEAYRPGLGYLMRTSSKRDTYTAYPLKFSQHHIESNAEGFQTNV